MTQRTWFGLATTLLVLWLGACSDSKNDSSADGGASGGKSGECPVIVSDKDCDKSKRPFVFVHGTYGSGDNFAHVAALLGSNGYCQDHIVGVEYNSLGGNPAKDGSIDKVIDAVLTKFPEFDQVDLAGHSQGTSHCGTYLQDAAHAKKVAHYINFSGIPAVGDVDTLSLSSMHDLSNTPHHATGNKVKTVTFTDEDHFAVAASRNSFIELYKYLNDGKAPKYTEVQCGDEMITIEGIAETFADNKAMGGKVEVREVDSERPDGKAITVMNMSTDGHFGPMQIKRGVAYEFKGFDEAGTLVGYQYFTPFKRSNYLMRMLSPSKNALVASNSTNHIVRDAGHAALIIRWYGGAFRQDLGGTLTVDGEEIMTSENSGADAFKTAALGGGVVALFAYDANKNKKSDLGLAFSAPFLSFTDVYMDATTPNLMDFEFTPGSEDPKVSYDKVEVPNYGSDKALISLIFQ
jgi:pimeloyl-ACP methyl ester carboxylesterase